MTYAPRSMHNYHVPSWQSYSFAWGPLVILVTLGVIVLLMKWAFSSGSSVVRRNDGAAGEPTEYGLLQPVAAPRSYEQAEWIREALREAGISSTISLTTQGLRVFVWPQDAFRARAIVRAQQN